MTSSVSRKRSTPEPTARSADTIPVGSKSVNPVLTIEAVNREYVPKLFCEQASVVQLTIFYGSADSRSVLSNTGRHDTTIF